MQKHAVGELVGRVGVVAHDGVAHLVRVRVGVRVKVGVRVRSGLGLGLGLGQGWGQGSMRVAHMRHVQPQLVAAARVRGEPPG